eukprot:9240603-Pyramimonas_sp.AAC.1
MLRPTQGPLVEPQEGPLEPSRALLGPSWGSLGGVQTDPEYRVPSSAPLGSLTDTSARETKPECCRTLQPSGS